MTQAKYIADYPKHLSKQFHALVLSMALLCSGCSIKNKSDPFEGYNRMVHHVNRAVDKGLIKPIAKTYHAITPTPVRKGVTNILDNLGEIPTAANDLLQGKFSKAANCFWRFFINSTLGFAGLIDVAEQVGLEKHWNNFGNTLATWGAHESPYFILPIMGPSTLRDAFGFAFDNTTVNPYLYIKPVSARNITYGVRAIDRRANLLKQERIASNIQLDSYAFEKNTYLQFRNSQLNKLLPNKIQPQSKYGGQFEDELDWALSEE